MGPFPPRAADNGGPALALVRGVHSTAVHPCDTNVLFTQELLVQSAPLGDSMFCSAG